MRRCFTRPKEAVMKTRWLSLSLLALAAGMGSIGGKPAASPPPEVEVVQPLVREMTDSQLFSGRTEAASSVQVKARVSGHLAKVLVKDGAEVKIGQGLFEIDPRPYRAELEKADAALALAEVRLKRAEAVHKQAKARLDSKTLTRDQFDKIAADRAEAKAVARLAAANRDIARLKVGFTRVTAPINGRLARRLVEPGCVVRADDTPLAAVSANTIPVSFEVSEEVALLCLRGKRAKAKWAVRPRLAMGLYGEDLPPQRPAQVDFADIRPDARTGKLHVWAVIPDRDGLLVPGLSIHVHLTLSDPYQALAVPSEAVRWSMEESLFVVNDRNKVEKRAVKVVCFDGSLVVVKEGLTSTERVVLKGPEGLEEGMLVRPKKVTMPPGK
jgi:RND family efflux transporter MFP subunit